MPTKTRGSWTFANWTMARNYLWSNLFRPVENESRYINAIASVVPESRDDGSVVFHFSRLERRPVVKKKKRPVKKPIVSEPQAPTKPPTASLLRAFDNCIMDPGRPSVGDGVYYQDLYGRRIPPVPGAE